MKKMYLVLLAAIIAVSMSSFTGSSETKRDPGELWFQLVTNGNPAIATDYFLVNGDGQSAPPCPTMETYRCGILTEPQGATDPNPGYPNLGTFSAERKRSTP